MRPALPVGRVQGHRGNRGEITVRVLAGDADHWCDVPFVLLTQANETRRFAVVESRAYRDRLVLKLEGIQDANRAAALRGAEVTVERELAPELAEDRHYRVDLIDMQVVDAVVGVIGVVEDVQPGTAHDLLIVRTSRDTEVLVPFVDSIVRCVDESSRIIEVELPEGLLSMNEKPDAV